MSPARDSENTELHSMLEAKEFPCLEMISGPRTGSRFPLKIGKNEVGRSSENDVVLDDSSVSRRHCILERLENAVSVTDLGSRNGTKVSGEKISGTKSLAHNTRVKIGIFELRLLNEESEPLPVSEAPPPEEDLEKEVEPPPEVPLPPEEGAAPEVKKEVPAKGGRRWIFLAIGLGLVVVGGGLIFQKFVLKGSSSAPQEAGGEVGGVLSAEKIEVPERDPGLQPFFLDFSSTPLPARIFFGDQEIGTTPFRTSSNLASGKWYEARALFPLPEIGETMEEKIQFTPSQGASVVPVLFAGKIGVFKIVSLPRDVQLYLEGYFEKDPYRARPVKFSEIVFGKPVFVPFGRYIIELRRSKQLGLSQTYLDEVVYRREFYLNGDQTSYAVDLSEESLKVFPVQISSVPAGAKVLIDDKEAGTTPFTGNFPVGEHLLTLRREGYFDFVQVMKMSLNMPYVAEIQLKTSEAGILINKADGFIKEERFTEALPVLVEAFSKNPTARETAQISWMVGLCYLRQKEYKQAEDYFLKAMQHIDYKYAGRLGVAQLTLEQGDAIKALKILVEVLISSEDPRVRIDAGVLFQRISPLKSVMYISSEPADARVFINGNEVNQKTPLILHELGVGSYRIRMQKEGYQEEEMKLNLGVSEFRPVVAKLKRIGG